MSKWKEFFPLKSPRKEQERALDELCEAVDGNERMLILEAGTGVGKSAIAVCLANYIRSKNLNDDIFSKGAYALTAQKILQDQYVRDFPQIQDIRSSSNFSCNKGPGDNCGQTMRYNMYTSTKDNKKPGCPNCPYRIAKEAFKSSPIGITNYAYFMSEVVYAGELLPRELLILDEAHNIENEMRRWSTIEINEMLTSDIGIEFPFGSSKETAISWFINVYRVGLVDYVMKLTKKLESLTEKGVKKGLSSLVDDLDKLDRHLCAVNRVITDDTVDDGMLINWDERKDGKRSLFVQPLNSGAIAKDFLYPRGMFTLMMSATLLDEKAFKKSAGIISGKYMSFPTPFPSKNFGVIYKPIGRMAKNQIKSTMPKMISAVRNILMKHPKDKGIIHCANYDVAKAIGTIDNRRLLVQTSSKDRDEILKKHFSSKNATVIVSPSMMEGLDLEGDLGRFQIICKVPFPNIGDPVVAAKINSDKSWYSWCTSRTLIQSIGRCVRSAEDYTKTYILDESFGNFFEEWAEMFPPYFLEMEIDL